MPSLDCKEHTLIKEHHTVPAQQGLPISSIFSSLKAPLQLKPRLDSIQDADLEEAQRLAHRKSTVSFFHYSFLAISNLENLSADLVNYLETQDCFRVPVRPVLNQFLRQYFQYVHPLMPLFNEGRMLALFAEPETYGPSSERFPLVVLQALLFATCNVSTRCKLQ
jgi:hypothetical protein